MRINKIILASLSIMGIVGEVSSFYKFSKAYNLINSKGKRSVQRVSDTYHFERSWGGIYGEKEFVFPCNVSDTGSVIGCVAFEKNTGICLLIKPNASMKIIDDRFILSQLFLDLKGPFDLKTRNKKYIRKIYEDKRLNNICAVKLDSPLYLDKDKKPSITLIQDILKEKESKQIRVQSALKGSDIKIENYGYARVRIQDSKGRGLELNTFLCLDTKHKKADPVSKALLTQSNILLVYCILEKKGNPVKTFVGLAEDRKTKEIFHWASELDTSDESFDINKMKNRPESK